MRWYDDQKASSRIFLSVEHRRNIHGSFNHEFLLLKLTDGAVCRLERVGEGSQADAIRYTGCTANDLIQWFSAEDYAKFESEHPSTLVSEVSFPFEYDILDVLAICYSIQNTEACRVYTLQRYNCYFLCLTVLAVLTRRAASWETEITDHVWDSALDCELTRLSNLPVQEVKNILMLRMCAMLEPNYPRCSKLLLDELRSQLYSGSPIAGELHRAVQPALWLSSCESETQIESIESCVSPLITNEKFSPTRLRSILMGGLQNSSQLPASNEAVVEFCNELLKLMRHIQSYSGQHYSNLCQMTEIEQPIPFRTMVLSWMLQFFSVVFVMFSDSIVIEGLNMDVRMLFGIGARTSIFNISDRLKAMEFYSGPLGYGAVLSAIESDRYEKLMVETINLSARDLNAFSMISVLGTLESKGMLEQEANVKLVLSHMLTKPNYFLEHSLVLSTLLSTLKIIFQGQPGRIRAKAWDNLSAIPEITTTLEFQQQYIQPRIHAHAERVALHKLAAAPLVSRDIHNTMTAVWGSLPPGFDGARRMSSQVSSRRNQL